MSRQVGDDLTSPGKNGKNLPPLPRSATQRHFPYVQGRALHIERGLGWFSNGGHIDLRIEGYLDTLGIIVTL